MMLLISLRRFHAVLTLGGPDEADEEDRDCEVGEDVDHAATRLVEAI